MAHDLTALTALTDLRATLAEEKKRIDEQLTQVNAKIIEQLPVGDNFESPAGRLTVSVRRTFKPAIAEQILEERDIDPAIRSALYVEKLDDKKLKALLPDVWDESVVESSPVVSFREAK